MEMPKIESKRMGLRTIAIFEAAKGFLVLFVGFGFTALLHHDARHFIEALTRHFRLNPAHHITAVFVTALERASDINLWLLASGALAYASLRFVEAYGLWKQRPWAEWLAIASGGIYLPIEFYELAVHVTAIKVGITAVNLAIVAYLIWERITASRRNSLAN